MPAAPSIRILGRAPCTALVRALVLVVGFAACGPAHDKPEQTGRGVLVGQVMLAPGAPLPAYAPSDIQRALLHGAAGTPPAGCADANERARRPVELSADRGLSGIVVAASDFTHTTLGWVKPKLHRVAIRDCRLQPAVIAMRSGDWLEVENQDAFAFEPHLGPQMNVERLAQGKRTKLFVSGARVDALLCALGAPCGRADVISFHHSVFGVTDASGRFRIEGFPDSELVRVTAWHPLFEPSENFVWVDPGKSQSLSFALQPKARFVWPN